MFRAGRDKRAFADGEFVKLLLAFDFGTRINGAQAQCIEEIFASVQTK